MKEESFSALRYRLRRSYIVSTLFSVIPTLNGASLVTVLFSDVQREDVGKRELFFILICLPRVH